ncbi:MAG: 4-hydroxy-tetrahydrodipicolinate synthase [Bacteroidales bacterium]
MNNFAFEGVGVALVTPFNHDRKIDYKALENLVKYHIDRKTDYIVALGTTGEAPCLSLDEKNEIVRVICSVTEKKIPLVVGVGDNETQYSVDSFDGYDFSKIDAVMSCVPYYNKPTQRGLLEHFKAIEKRSPVPILLYNVPSRTGVNMTSKTTLELAHHSNKIAGIKEAAGDVVQVSEIIKDAPNHFSVVSGDDALTLPTMSLGGKGVISVLANIYPSLCVEMVRKFLAGKIHEARDVHNRTLDLCHLLFAEGNPCGIKAAMAEIGLLQNVLRLPLVPVGESTQKKIAKELENYKDVNTKC